MSDTPRTDKHELEMSEQYELIRECGWPAHDITNIADFARQLERERDILFAAITEAVARFDELSWGWDGDCGSGNIMRELEEARDKVCTLNPSHHAEAGLDADSVDGVVQCPNKKEKA